MSLIAETRLRPATSLPGLIIQAPSLESPLSPVRANGGPVLKRITPGCVRRKGHSKDMGYHMLMPPMPLEPMTPDIVNSGGVTELDSK
jgi:hypothetical protein